MYYQVTLMKGFHHNVIHAGHDLAVVVDRVWMSFRPSEMSLADWHHAIGSGQVEKFLKKGLVTGHTVESRDP